MNKFRRYCLVALAAVFLFSAATGFCDDYTIGPGDRLNVTVYENPDLTRTVQVSGDGNIVLPLIGEFRAKGLTATRLSQVITGKLASGYLVNPQVTVVVEEYRSLNATILGKVNKPALYDLRGKTTLLELISTAGGLAPDAGQYAYVTRVASDKNQPDAGRKEVIRIDLKKLVEEGDTTQNILINDGDSIFISKMEKIYVTGQVKSAGSYSYEEGLTVIKAVTKAGGFTDLASTSGIKIVRKGNGEEQILSKVKMDDLVEPEDVIVVPESFF
ncbi:MAG: polysaccharide biosynthesis/export family protein [Thermodesulfobacteriota bacterium]